MSLFIYGRKSKAVSNLNFLSFLFCFSWWSSPGRLYEKTTLGMFQWASVIWGGEIIITITSSIIITSIPTIFMSLRSPEWPLTLKMEVTKSEVQLWRNELTVLLKHLMCTPKRTQMWNWSIDLYWVLVWLMVQTKKSRNLLCSVVYAGILCIQIVHHLLAYFWPICSMYSNFTDILWPNQSLFNDYAKLYLWKTVPIFWWLPQICFIFILAFVRKNMKTCKF